MVFDFLLASLTFDDVPVLIRDGHEPSLFGFGSIRVLGNVLFGSVIK